MRCPACQFPTLEDDAACRQCGFALEAVDRLFGIPPVLERPVTDLSRALAPREHSRVAAAVRAIEQRFPQISCAVVLSPVPDGVAAETWAFWLFNRGSLFSAVEKGGENHGILLFIDTVDHQASLTIGYGLEPFVAEDFLATCLSESAPALTKRRHASAILSVISKLETHLTDICENLPRQFGYEVDDAWIDSSLDSESQSRSRAQSDELF